MKYLDSVYTFFIKFISMLFLILLPIRSVMIAVGVLIAADLITGIWAALKMGEPITSRGLKKTVTKMIAYQVAIITMFVIETWLVEGVPLVKAVAGLIAITEGKSFLENIHRITGVDFWEAVLKQLRDSTVKALPDELKDEKNDKP